MPEPYAAASFLPTLPSWAYDRLMYHWRHPDPWMDALADRLLTVVDTEQKRGATRVECFRSIWTAAHESATPPPELSSGNPIPHLSEGWYCCAEPMQDHVTLV